MYHRPGFVDLSKIKGCVLYKVDKDNGRFYNNSQ